MTDARLSTLTVPLVRARLDEALSKNYPGGVIGVRARPVWDGDPRFEHRGLPVRVAPCVSALAVRDQLRTWPGDGWLVIVTDRTPEDLGEGILAHLIGYRLRTPDEWEALRQRFAAAGIDPALQADARSRQVAVGLLAAEPEDGWPPAPGGVLTRAHALTAVLRERLGVGADHPGAPIDGPTVLEWTSRPGSAEVLAQLRVVAGDGLVDAAIAFAAERLGRGAEPVLHLLRAGQVLEVQPLGLVASLLVQDGLDPDDAQVAKDARIRLERQLGAAANNLPALRAWSVEANSVTAGPSVLARADALLTDLQAGQLAARSDILPSGLHARLSVLAERLRAAGLAAADRATRAPDSALVAGDAVAGIESAWSLVQRHRAARTDSRIAAFRATVRLARWLATDSDLRGGGIADLVARHRDADAWVDLAVNDAAAGVGDANHAAALSAVLRAVATRRDAHDAQFGTELAALTRDDPADPGVRYIEDVLASDVAPILRTGAPVLLLVLDGMSVATAIEVLADAGRSGWTEYARADRRGIALAALPTLTAVSRTSLLCGQLTSGGQAEEVAGLAEFGRARGLRAALFHKKLLDSSRPGFAVSDEVGSAIDDVAGTPLVGCVLNTVDDALDRSDPGTVDWTLDAIKHLRPLLERARTAGRAVVLTADHGHVVERRLGEQRSYPNTTSNRSRAAEPSAGVGEVLVEGRRVVGSGGRAVLAVDERVRYGPLKAGYHGGASPAEVLVPVCHLVAAVHSTRRSAPVDPVRGLQEIGPQAPLWWDVSYPDAPDSVVPPSGARPGHRAASRHGGQQALPGLETPEDRATPDSRLVEAVLGSRTFAVQIKLAGRAASTSQIREALVALLADPAHRRPLLALPGVSGTRARGAFAMLQRILNVEGYQVLSIDPDGVTAVLDPDLLTEQFGVQDQQTR